MPCPTSARGSAKTPRRACDHGHGDHVRGRQRGVVLQVAEVEQVGRLGRRRESPRPPVPAGTSRRARPLRQRWPGPPARSPRKRRRTRTRAASRAPSGVGLGVRTALRGAAIPCSPRSTFRRQPVRATWNGGALRVTRVHRASYAERLHRPFRSFTAPAVDVRLEDRTCGDHPVTYRDVRIEKNLRHDDAAMSAEPTDRTVPTGARVSRAWTVRFGLLWFGSWLAYLGPVQLALPNQFDAFDPAHKVRDFGIVSGATGCRRAGGAAGVRRAVRPHADAVRPAAYLDPRRHARVRGRAGGDRTADDLGRRRHRMARRDARPGRRDRRRDRRHRRRGARTSSAARSRPRSTARRPRDPRRRRRADRPEQPGRASVTACWPRSLVAHRRPVPAPLPRPAPDVPTPVVALRAVLAGLWVSPRANPDFAWAFGGRLLVNLGNALGTTYLLFFLQDDLRLDDPDGGLLVLTLVYLVFSLGRDRPRRPRVRPRPAGAATGSRWPRSCRRSRPAARRLPALRRRARRPARSWARATARTCPSTRRWSPRCCPMPPTARRTSGS